MFIGRTDAEAKAPIFWPPHVKDWLIRKDPDAGKDCGQEEKGMTEDEMVGWHHRLDGHGSGWTPGVGDGQGGLACCSSWGHKESDTTERLNWTELSLDLAFYGLPPRPGFLSVNSCDWIRCSLKVKACWGGCECPWWINGKHLPGELEEGW